ncbi:MAG: hypothetical protein IKX93_05825, partial [Bacteroidaceae bacterium]|nr:hypothetical protein [Bacteroidaceae bacterium]
MSAISPYVVCGGEEKIPHLRLKIGSGFLRDAFGILTEFMYRKSRAICVPGFLKSLFLFVDFLEGLYTYCFGCAFYT